MLPIKTFWAACILTGLTASISVSAETVIEFDPIKARPLSTLPATKEAAMPPKLVTADGQQLYANMWYKYAWEYATPAYGIYAFPTSESTQSTFPPVILNNNLCGNAGAVYANGKYFVATSEEVTAPNGGYVVMSMRFFLFDTLDWSCVEIPNADEEFKAMDMAYDPMTDKVYGCFVKRGANGYYYFGTLDINTGRVTMIRNYGQDSHYAFTGVTVSGAGTVYAINSEGALYSVDKTTGVATLIGQTGLADQYMTSATFSPSSGKIYYALNSDIMTGMYEINPVNAVAKRLYSFPDQESIAGMYLPEDLPDNDAPAQASSMSAEFVDGSLTGKVSFTAPTKTYGGSTLSGTLNYELKANGVEIARGTATAGAAVVRNVTVAQAGEYSFAVTFSNSAGNGATARTALFVGPDVPLPPTDVTLAQQADGLLRLSWTPGASAHGGWLDPEALKYVVTRKDGSMTTETSATVFTEPVPDPTTRTRNEYTVAARTGSFTGEAVESNAVYTGSYSAPHTESFDTNADIQDYLIDDGDKDGKSWMWSEGQMHSSICLDKQVDDMLFLPPVTLQRGMSYRISIRAKATRSPLRVYPERVSVWAGDGRTRADMKVEVIPPTDVTTDEYETLTALYTPSTSGPCHFGILACSDPDNYYLWVDDFTVSEPVRSDVPNPVEALSVTPGVDGTLTADISCTLPGKAMTGTDLGAISAVEIYRDNTLLASRPGQPGQKFTFTDANVPNGEHTYGVVVCSDAGSSLRESATIYVGVHQPVPVTMLTAVRGDANNRMKLSWTAPVSDTEGTPLPQGSVTYRVTRYDRAETVVANDLSAIEFTDDINNAGSAQEFVQYAVTAVNVAGESTTAWSNTTTYGPLLPTPMKESFADGVATQEFVVERDDDNASWTVTNPASNPGIADQDSDGGLLRFTGVITGAHADFISGNYSLDGLGNPALIFYFLYPMGSTEGLSVTLMSQKDGMLTSREVKVLPDARIDGWQRCIIPITDDPESIQFTLSGVNTGEYATSIFVDNLSLADLPTPNVTLYSLTASSVVEANTPFTLSAYVENSGIEDIEAEVTLYLNDEPVDAKTVALESGERDIVEFEYILGSVQPEDLIFHAEATTTADKVSSDNRSADLRIGVHHNIYPSPQATVAVTGATGKPEITWQAPDLGPDSPEAIVESAEGYTPFSIGLPGSVLATDYMGQWTSVDADGLYTLGVGHNDVAIPNAATPKAFMVFNGEAGNMGGDAWKARSGKSMFIAFAAIADSGFGNDDWLISPLLPGNAQQVSLWARSATDLYGLESMEILYSAKSIDVKDFKLLKSVKEVPATWTKYEVTLPEGALYFAIRCTSKNMFALCVDDISFTQAGLRATGLALEGYNLYRDYQLLASLDAGVTAYTDPTPTSKGTPYHVTARYNMGESRPGNTAILDVAGISEVVSPSKVTVTGVTGRINIQGADGANVCVFLPDGRLVASGSHSSFEVSPGVYIVTVANQAFKINTK